MTIVFQPGAGLCERFYWDCVRPILDARFPGLAHAAALIDSGSEVLGFDDAMSMDHHWGPRVLLFLRDDDHPQAAPAIEAALARELPYAFEGFSTNFTPPNPDDHGTQSPEHVTTGLVQHRVACHTLRGFWAMQLNFDLAQPLGPADWLTFAEQRLLCLTTGPVYHDGLGLNAVRARFSYYPRDVWLYLLAAGWTRLGQEEHLMGRAGFAGDELGSAVIAARLVRDIMRLCFLMERRYAPYPKWFGSAFKQLARAEAFGLSLAGALQAQTWQAREAHLVEAYAALAVAHNTLELTQAMPVEPQSFFGRPFRVMALHGFAAALIAQIRDPAVQRLADRPLIGSLDLFSDNTDLIDNPVWRPVLRQLYE